MNKYFIFGATGSVGIQTIDVIQKNNGKVVGISFYHNLDKAKELILKYQPQYVISFNNLSLDGVKTYQKENIEEILNKLDKDTFIVNAINGIGGLKVSELVLKHGFNLYLANKESLVLAGDILNKLAKGNDVSIIPIDSEHNSLLKLLDKQNKEEVKNIIITASGGALRNKVQNFESISKDDILRHPNWLMGPYITVNSATMINKVYEVIEAHHLFDFDYKDIIVLQHDESIVHSMVEFLDGSFSASMGPRDMENAINYALNYPKYVDIGLEEIDFVKINSLHFNKLNLEVYPIYDYALNLLKKGGYYPTIVNCVNEYLVSEFLNNSISFKELITWFEKYCLDGIKYFKNSIYFSKELNIENILSLHQELFYEFKKKGANR